jgi:ubiquinone/menaquinone biosynthesis C-methylase UbiE
MAQCSSRSPIVLDIKRGLNVTNEKFSSGENDRVAFSDEATDFFHTRRASTQAAFFLPYLQPGMKLLDCGCGPGSITVDLAEIVAPAKVIGIDIDEKHLRLANAHAKRRNVENVQFETGDVRTLVFPDEAFDAVFVHGVIEYLDAEQALSEIYRVLKTGGVVGSRHGDYGGFLIAPESPELTENIELFVKLLAHNGGDPHCGRNQLAAMRKVGFKNIKPSASYDFWTEDQAATRYMADAMAAYCLSSEFADPVIKLGFTDRPRLEEISAAWRDWGEDESAFAAEAWGEAVAWKA